MKPEDLDALAPELQALLDAERAPTPAPSAAKARVMAKLTATLFPIAGGGGLGGGDGGGGHGGATGGHGAAGGASHGAAGVASHAGASGVAAHGASGVAAHGAAASGVAAGASAVVGAGATSAGGMISAALVTKLVVGVGVASFAVGGAVGAGVHSVVATPAPTAQVAPKVAVAPVQPPPVVKVEPEVAPPVVADAPPVVTPPPTKLDKPKPAPTDDTLAEERSLMEMARTALSRNDAPAALEALKQHERRFAAGQLAEERMALQVLALSRAGRTDEAQTLAKKFRAKFPTGLFRAVVDGAAPDSFE